MNKMYDYKGLAPETEVYVVYNDEWELMKKNVIPEPSSATMLAVNKVTITDVLFEDGNTRTVYYGKDQSGELVGDIDASNIFFEKEDAKDYCDKVWGI